jgi:Na+-transporting NADH:ubiquinone oxidoreductase subunit NqrD
MSVLWISFLALLCNADYESTGGLELNGFLCFLLWIIFMFIMIKVSMKIADIGFLIVHLVFRFFKFGYSDQLGIMIGFIILSCILFLKNKKKYLHK